MLEYRIERRSKLLTVKKLWRLFLKDDPMWHFTLEGSYIEVRVSKDIPELDEFLNGKKWKYTKFEYKDAIPITKKYQKEFEYIFHGFSELAMKMPKEKPTEAYSDLHKCYERVVHLYANMCGLGLVEEAYKLARLAVERSHTAGKYSK